VHDQRHAPLHQHGVRRVERGVVAAETAVHRVQLQRCCTEVELALQLAGDREVQMGVDVGDRPEAPGVVLDERQQIVELLIAGRLGAVFAEQQGDIHALLGEQRVKRLRARRALGRPDLLQHTGRAELARPGDPGGGQRRQDGDMDVRVDEQVAIEH